MLRLHDVAGQRAELAERHLVQHALRPHVPEREADRVGVERLERRPHAESVRRRTALRGDVAVHQMVVPVEHHVVRVERIAVGPFGALDQVHRELVAILGPLPALGEVGQRRELVGPDLEQRAGTGEALPHAVLDAAPALVLAGDPVPALGPPADDVAHHVAIDAGAVLHRRRLEDQRFLGQALGDRRQLTGVDELLGHPGGFMVGGEGAERVDVGGADEIDLAARLEFGWVGNDGWRNHLRQGGGARNAHQQSRHRNGVYVFRHFLSPAMDAKQLAPETGLLPASEPSTPAKRSACPPANNPIILQISSGF